jgi:hypothetical protein
MERIAVSATYEALQNGKPVVGRSAAARAHGRREDCRRDIELAERKTGGAKWRGPTRFCTRTNAQNAVIVANNTSMTTRTKAKLVRAPRAARR